MSRAGGDPLLVTRVDITGNTAPLERTIASAKVEATEAAASIGAAMSDEKFGQVGNKKFTSLYDTIAADAAEAASAVDGVTASTERLGNEKDKTSNKSNGLFATMRTGYAAVAGAIALVVLNMQRLVDLFSDGETRYAKFLKTIESGTPEQVVKRANAELTDLQDQLRRFSSLDPFALWNAGFSRSNIEEQIQSVEKLVELNQAIVNAQKDAAENNERIAREVELRSQLVQLRIAELDGVDRINAETRAAIEENATLQEKAKGRELELLKQIAEQIVRNSEVEKAKIAEAERVRKAAEEKAAKEQIEREQREADRKEQERQREAEKVKQQAEAQAKAFAEAYSNTFASLRRDAANIFPADQLAGSIERLSELLEALAEQRSRL